MRIMHVGKYFLPERGGMETAVYSILKGLTRASNLQVQCTVANKGGPQIQENYEGIPITRLRRLAQVASTPICLGLEESIKSFKPDLLHVHLPNPLVTLQLLRQKIPMVSTYHCDIIRYPQLLKLYSPWLRKFLNLNEAIVVSSPDLKNSRYLKSFEEKIRVIPLSVDEERFALSEQNTNRVQDLKAQHGSKIVLFVGRLVPYKGLSVLFEAMKSVEAKLLVVGTGPEQAALEKLIRSNSLEGKIEMVGEVSDLQLPVFYHAADLVVLPSLNASEAFGMCLVEAMACSKPVVTTTIGTGVEYVNLAGHTGLSVPPGDGSRLANAIGQILFDEVLKNRMGREARKHFENSFQIKKIVKEHVELYKTILDIKMPLSKKVFAGT